MRLPCYHGISRLTSRLFSSTSKTSAISMTKIVANSEQIDRTTTTQQTPEHAKSPRPPITHFVFGANTDVGKTVLTAALIRAAGAKQTDGSGATATHYIKPLQCGGSDEAFVKKHSSDYLSSSTTLFHWNTPASPHFAARIENKPVSDDQVLEALTDCLQELKSTSMQDAAAVTNISINDKSGSRSSIWVETAGGVMSPSSSSPQNSHIHHAKTGDSVWGWRTQADLYKEVRSPSVVLIGDGRLGGISSTLAALEALLHRNYSVGGILLMKDRDSENGSHDPNLEALQEYATSYPLWQSSSLLGDQSPPHSSIFDDPEKSILSLPKLPPEPEPLNEWFASSDVKDPIFAFVHEHLFQSQF